MKAIALDENGNIAALAQRSYEYDAPAPGYAEQDSAVWRDAMYDCLAQLWQSGLSPADIACVGFSGQMHGLVALDKNGDVVRPAILHNDARSAEQVAFLNDTLPRDVIENTLMNPAYTGFLLVSLLWVREHEPKNYDRIAMVMLPKDYLFYCLTGRFYSDYSDSSATFAFDIKNNAWASAVLRAVGVSEALFAPLGPSYEPAGGVSASAAAATGLKQGTPVVPGGGDALMQSLGNGLLGPGRATVNIGSAGQVFFPSDAPTLNAALSTNTFCGYERGRWYTMGAIMSAGLSFKWISRALKETDYKDLDRRIDALSPGSGGLVFLPYLNGERTPHVNPNLSGMFLGLSHETTSEHLARAVMEGVSFALLQCAELCMSLGLSAELFIASGGGSHSPIWVQMLSDIFARPFCVSETKEQAATGAAMCAGVGGGIWPNLEEASHAVVKLSARRYEPNAKNADIYRDYYELFKDAYAQNKELLERSARLRKE